MSDSCRRSEGGRSGGGGESNTALNQTEESLISDIETYVNNLIMQSGMT